MNAEDGEEKGFEPKSASGEQKEEREEEAEKKKANHVLAPKCVSRLRNDCVSVAVCGGGFIATFLPTCIHTLVPACGPVSGGTKLSIIGSGIFPPEEETKEGGGDPTQVLFTLVNADGEEGASYQCPGRLCEDGSIETTTPSFDISSIPELELDNDRDEDSAIAKKGGWKVLVEVALDGINFTADECTFTIYKMPEITSVAPENCPRENSEGKCTVSFSYLCARFFARVLTNGHLFSDP